MRKGRMVFWKYIVAFGLSVCIALGMLVVSAFFPQTPILQNAAESVDIVYHDAADNFFADRASSNLLDASTDTLMLRVSLSTNDRYLGSVLTNPIYTYDDLTPPDSNVIADWGNMAETFERLSYDMPADSVFYYARYWMGFRSILRFALMLFNFGQIKRYMAVTFFVLFTMLICSISKHLNQKIAFLFALSIILVRPYVIAVCMQYMCCFFIAFMAMLLVPWIYKNPRYEMLFFMEIGILTMYLDFYTVPLLTFGLPMIYLFSLRAANGEGLSVKQLLLNFLFWIAGYALMWLAKLTLTTLLTPVDALGDGLRSFFARVGVVKDPALDSYYSLSAAFEGIRKSLFADETGMVVYLVCAAAILLTVVVKLVRRHTAPRAFTKYLAFGILALMPLGWFAVTKQPVAIHYFYQYRTIAVTHWASGVFFYFLLDPPEPALKTVE